MLGLAAILRLAHSADNPGWYTDELTHLDIARHLLAGRVQYMAVGQSWLLFGRLPQFELLLAGAFRLAGPEIATQRALTGLLGVAAVGLVYLILRRASGKAAIGGLAALLLAVYPQAVLYSRFGFSYNLLAVLVLAAFGCLLENLGAEESRGRRWLVGLGVCAGLGLITDVQMIAFAPLLLIAIALRRWPDALRAAAIMAVPPLIYLAWMLGTAPNAFLFDLAFTLGRMSRPLADQLPTLASNLAALGGDGWFVGGAAGLMMCSVGRDSLARMGRVGLGLLLGVVILVGRTAALYSLSAYYTIPLLPLLTLGLAGGVVRIVEWSTRPLPARTRYVPALAAGLVIGVLLLRTAPDDLRHVQTGFPTEIDAFLIAPADARAVAAYVNDRVQPDDVVIASPGVGWLIRADVADFQMTVAVSGEAGPNLPGNLPAGRWAFDPGLDGARFVVVDNLWRTWGAAHLPGARAMLDRVAGWPRVFQSGAIEVFANPALGRGTDESSG